MNIEDKDCGYPYMSFDQKYMLLFQKSKSKVHAGGTTWESASKKRGLSYFLCLSGAQPNQAKEKPHATHAPVLNNWYQKKNGRDGLRLSYLLFCIISVVHARRRRAVVSAPRPSVRPLGRTEHAHTRTRPWPDPPSSSSISAPLASVPFPQLGAVTTNNAPTC